LGEEQVKDFPHIPLELPFENIENLKTSFSAPIFGRTLQKNRVVWGIVHNSKPQNHLAALLSLQVTF